MSGSKILVVMSYDISLSKIRNKVADRLEEFMTRVQQSVFEGRLSRPKADTLFDEISDLIKPGDSLRLYIIGAIGEEKCRTIGGPPLMEQADFWLL